MTYEYLCTACENVWEAQQSISEAPLKVCPRCHKETAKRQVSGGAGFILKGGGWYADLYGSSQKKPEGKSEKSEPSADAKTDSKKAEPASGDSGTKKDTPKGDGGKGGGTSSGSGTKGGADSSAA